MKVDANLLVDLADVASKVREVEAAGYSGVWTAEMAHDPFLPLMLAAQSTTAIDIGTSIAVAFARSPMTVANTAWDPPTPTPRQKMPSRPPRRRTPTTSS